MARTIPVVFSADDAYAPYLAVAVRSLIAHAAPENRYEVWVLEQGVSPHQQRMVCELAAGHPNVAVRFVNVDGIIGRYDRSLFPLLMHFSVATYYRLFVPELFPKYDKVLYLDCDIVILDDVAEIFDAPLGNNLIAAMRDPIVIEQADKQMPYYRGVLKLDDVRDYFQAGVLLMNLKQMRSFSFIEKCLQKLAEVKKPALVDQDILNAVCQKRVAFLPMRWNFLWHVDFEFAEDFEAGLPKTIREDLAAARENPGIIHYASHKKPWSSPELPLSHRWWFYARQTPFYELILRKHLSSVPAPVKKSWAKRMKYKLLSCILFGEKRSKYQKKYRKCKR